MAWQNEFVRPGKSVTELVEGLVGDIQEILRSEIRLAKAEIKAEGAKAAKAGALLGAGLILAWYAGGLLLLACVYALAIALPVWLAALIMFAGSGMIGAAFIFAGAARLKRVHAAPEKTISTMKENVRWAKDQMK